MQAEVGGVVDRVARAEAPDVWSAFSPHVRAEIVDIMAEQSTEFIAELLQALQVRDALHASCLLQTRCDI